MLIFARSRVGFSAARLKFCSFSSGLRGLSSMFVPLWISACVRARASWVGFLKLFATLWPPEWKSFGCAFITAPPPPKHTHTHAHIHSGSRDDLPVPLQRYSASNFSFIQTRTAFPSSVFTLRKRRGERQRGAALFLPHTKSIKTH